jgi:hypothetical protein
MMPIKRYKVRSQTDKKTIYEVEVYSDGVIMCNCPNYLMRHERKLTDCKHGAYIRNKYYSKPNEIQRTV